MSLPVVLADSLRGYLLEECLAWLLRSSGYELLSAHDAPDVLAQSTPTSALFIRGRGAWHQADVLGQFSYVPPFSLPIRLFVEAKCWAKSKVGLDVIRNGHGVIHDINQNLVTTSPEGPKDTDTPGHGGRLVRPRYLYAYAVFSMTGFSPDAVNFALAHQISLVDLSVLAFEGLRRELKRAAKAITDELRQLPEDRQPTIGALRSYMRDALGLDGHRVGDTPLTPAIEIALDRLVDRLRDDHSARLILAFPEAPFVLGLIPDNLSKFVRYAEENPRHEVHLRPGENVDGHRVWHLVPHEEQDLTMTGIEPRESAYGASFVLPQQIEDWILQDERRAVKVKRRLLSNITIYWSPDDSFDGYTRTFQLQYQPMNLPRP
jgi:hypothetical protein